MNKLDVSTRKEVDVTLYKFGLSALRAWMLNISYRLEVNKWQIRKPDREKGQQRKHNKGKVPQRDGLTDVPKPGGSGITNDGNTARRFFRDPTLPTSIDYGNRRNSYLQMFRHLASTFFRI
jgi:hypothetical protein